jgi:hypothetical protein
MKPSLVRCMSSGLTWTILQYAVDPGGAIAKYIDSHDAAPNNGWIDVAY